MKPTLARIAQLAKRRRLRGLTTVEYAVAGALMAAGVVVAFTNLGGSVAGRITEMAAIVGGEAGPAGGGGAGSAGGGDAGTAGGDQGGSGDGSGDGEGDGKSGNGKGGDGKGGSGGNGGGQGKGKGG